MHGLNCFKLATLGLVFSFSAIASADTRTPPTKLQLIAPLAAIRLNSRVTLAVQLANAANQATPAAADLLITITDGQGDSQTKTLPAGQSVVQISWEPKSTGLIRIVANEPHLFSGSALLRVVPAATTGGSVDGAGGAGGSGGGFGRDGGGHQLESAAIEIPSTTIPRPSPKKARAPIWNVPPLGAPTASLPTVVTPAVPQLLLTSNYDLTNHARADGVDPCIIYALLKNPPSSEVTVTLQPVNGQLTPILISLNPANGFYNVATLTSTNPIPAKVTVTVGTTTPRIATLMADPLVMQFAHPVDHYEIDASRDALSMIETSQIIVKLLDRSGRVTQTDEPLTVDFSIAGDGDLSVLETKIPANATQSEAITFTPKHTGYVTIAASVENLRAAPDYPLKIRFPTVILSLTTLGGCCGGVVAYLWEKKAKPSRIFIGFITGLALYWAFFYGLLGRISSTAALTNASSAFVVAVIGGFAGPKVLDLLFKIVAPGASLKE